MLSAKRVNQNVVKMYKDEPQPYIETTITFRTPIERGSDLHKKFSTFMGNIAPTLEGVNNNVEEIIGDTFEADIVSIYSGVRNLLK